MNLTDPDASEVDFDGIPGFEDMGSPMSAKKHSPKKKAKIQKKPQADAGLSEDVPEEGLFVPTDQASNTLPDGINTPIQSSTDIYDVNASPENSPQPPELPSKKANIQIGATGGIGDQELAKPDLDEDIHIDPEDA